MTALQDIPIRMIDGEETTLDAYRGKTLLIVNTASRCGLTGHYEGLQSLYHTYRGRGLEVFGFPSNDFNGQEPGANAEIAKFCETTFGVDFPMFEKISVAGPAKHPLYAALTAAAPVAISTTGNALGWKLASHGIAVAPAPELQWNFEKFVVNAAGEVTARFAPDTAPDDPALVSAIETQLGE